MRNCIPIEKVTPEPNKKNIEFILKQEHVIQAFKLTLGKESMGMQGKITTLEVTKVCTEITRNLFKNLKIQDTVMQKNTITATQLKLETGLENENNTSGKSIEYQTFFQRLGKLKDKLHAAGNIKLNKAYIDFECLLTNLNKGLRYLEKDVDLEYIAPIQEFFEILRHRVDKKELFDSMDEQYLLCVTKYFGPNKKIDEYELAQQFGYDFINIVFSLANKKVFTRAYINKQGMLTSAITFHDIFKLDISKTEFDFRDIYIKNKNYFTMKIGFTFLAFFHDVYSNVLLRVNAFNQLFTNKKSYYFMYKKVEQVPSESDADVIVTSSNRELNPLVDISEKTINEYYAAVEKNLKKIEMDKNKNIEEQDFIVIDPVFFTQYYAAKLHAPEIAIYPCTDWEALPGVIATQNYTGISNTNKKYKIRSLTNSHWVHSHEFIPSQSIIDSLNYIQGTPYILNSNAFNYYYSNENAEYVDFNKFKKAKDILKYLYKNRNQKGIKYDRKKRNAEIEQIKEQEKICSQYYEQQLYENGVRNAQKQFEKAANISYMEINQNKNIMRYLKNFSISEIYPLNIMCYYFPCGLDFRKRLISQWRVHYLNSNIFRLCLNTVYTGLQNSKSIQGSLIARQGANYNNDLDIIQNAKQAKKAVGIYALQNSINNINQPNYEVICLDAVASGVQHNQLYQQDGSYAAELYFKKYKPHMKLYERINSISEKKLKRVYYEAMKKNPKQVKKFIKIIKKQKQQKLDKGHPFNLSLFAYESDERKLGGVAMNTTNKISKTSLNTMKVMRLQLNSKKEFGLVTALGISPKGAAIISTEMLGLANNSSSILDPNADKIRTTLPKAMVLLSSYGASIYGLERQAKAKLEKNLPNVKSYGSELANITAHHFQKVEYAESSLLDLYFLFRQIAVFATTYFIELSLPCPFNCYIKPKYRIMTYKRIARSIPIHSSKNSTVHNIRSRVILSPRKLNVKKYHSAFFANLIQQRDADCVHLTVLHFMRIMKPNHPFIGMFVHDSISFHSQFEFIIRSFFRLSHVELYTTSTSPVLQRPKYTNSAYFTRLRKLHSGFDASGPLLSNVLTHFNTQFQRASAAFSQPIPPSNFGNLQKVINFYRTRFKYHRRYKRLNWKQFKKDAQLLSYQ